MKRFMLAISLSLTTIMCSAQDNLNFKEFKKNQDQLEYDISRLNSISITPVFPYPSNILEMTEKMFNKKLVILFPPKVYQGLKSHGYIACFMDEDKNLYSVVYDSGKIIDDSVSKNFSNTVQAKYCGRYLEYAKSKNEVILNDNNYIDEKTGNIKHKDNTNKVSLPKGDIRF